jgi:hypothetical protein
MAKTVRVPAVALACFDAIAVAIVVFYFSVARGVNGPYRPPIPIAQLLPFALIIGAPYIASFIQLGRERLGSGAGMALGISLPTVILLGPFALVGTLLVGFAMNMVVIELHFIFLLFYFANIGVGVNAIKLARRASEGRDTAMGAGLSLGCILVLVAIVAGLNYRI